VQIERPPGLIGHDAVSPGRGVAIAQRTSLTAGVLPRWLW